MPKPSTKLKSSVMECQGSTRNRIFTLEIQSLHSALADDQALALNWELLGHLSNQRVKTIRFKAVSQGLVYQTTLLDFVTLGTPDFDSEFGLQQFLPIRFWKVTSMGKH